MSWRDPSTYIFHFSDGTEISCNGIIGVFSSDCGLDSTYEKLRIQSFEKFTSETREEYRKYLEEWKGEMPERMTTEEYINSHPEERKYFNCEEGFEIADKLENYFGDVVTQMKNDFDYRLKLLGEEKEFITGDDEEDLFDEHPNYTEPSTWFRSSGFAYTPDYWFACAEEDDVRYSKEDIAHIRLLLEFLGKLKSEFEKRKTNGGWYLSMFIPY